MLQMAAGVGGGERGVEQVKVLVGEGKEEASLVSEDVLGATGATPGVYEAAFLVIGWEGGRAGERLV